MKLCTFRTENATCIGVGAAMKPMRLLAAGDVARVEIEGLSAIENRVDAEPETALI